MIQLLDVTKWCRSEHSKLKKERNRDVTLQDGKDRHMSNLTHAHSGNLIRRIGRASFVLIVVVTLS